MHKLCKFSQDGFLGQTASRITDALRFILFILCIVSSTQVSAADLNSHSVYFIIL